MTPAARGSANPPAAGVMKGQYPLAESVAQNMQRKHILTHLTADEVS